MKQIATPSKASATTKNEEEGLSLRRTVRQEITQINDVEVLEKLSEGISDVLIHLLGNFGEVYKGKWNGSLVALKKLKAEEVSTFEKEAAILLYYFM